MKRLFTLAAVLIGFLFFPVVAFADTVGTFTATNVSYDSTSNILSFHASGFTSLPTSINYLGICSDSSCIAAGMYGSITGVTPSDPIDLSSTIDTGGFVTMYKVYVYSSNCSCSWVSQDLTSPTPTITPSPTPSDAPSPTPSDIPSQSPSEAPTPTDAPDQIYAHPNPGNVYVGQPFSIDVGVRQGSEAFNAVQASVAVSSNLTIMNIENDMDGDECHLNYTKAPTTSDPSFVGSIFNSSSTGCDIYTLVLQPNAAGTGTIHFSNGSLKAYSDQSELFAGFQDATFTINDQLFQGVFSGGPNVSVTSPLETYKTNYTLSGTKDSTITHVLINGSESGVTFPTDTTWQAEETLTPGVNKIPGDNTFTLDGIDVNGNHIATQHIDISVHAIGDINGDGNVDLTDASLFAVDFGKSSDLTYPLSDMNNDGIVDLNDLSILAKAE